MRQLEFLSNQSNSDYYETFRKLYYFLYSNSSASRAERIISDLSKILLISVANLSSEQKLQLQKFLDGKASANETLIPIIQADYSEVFDDGDRFGIDDEALRYALESIAKLDLKHAPSHAVGDAFQALIGPNLRGDKGQFFTPKTLTSCIVDIFEPAPGSKVVDPACGTGGFLTEVALYWARNNLKSGSVLGIDKDKDLYTLATALLKICSRGKSHTFNQNSLDIDLLKRLPKAKSPFNSDYVLTNPPFGSKIPITDKRILNQYELGFVWEYSKESSAWLKKNLLRPSQDPQTLFLELCVRLLKEDGRMALVLPEGMFGNKTCGYVWDYLRSTGVIEGLIDCPRTTFQPGTDTKTNVLFYRKSKATKHQKIKIAVALDCGHDRRGRTTQANNEPYKNDFAKIATDWKSKKHDYCFDAIVTNPYYLVPRYYDQKTNQLLMQDAEAMSGKLITFNEMIEKGWLTIKKGHEVGSDAYGTGNKPFVRTSDISNFEISIDPTKSVSDEIYEQYSKEQNLRAGDILFVVDGRYRIGRSAILHEYNAQCIAQSHLRIISVDAKTSPLGPYELLYLLSLPSVQRDIRSLVFIQSTLGSIGTRVGEIKIPLPDKKDHIFSKKVRNFQLALEKRASLLESLLELDNQSIEL